ncbi:hypothetical protein KO465_01690 [Candidatus Micrarchaeota archaeon]|nr:hypothetical protein [Candidatus Micrarchaeota archaeon]
MVAKRKTKNKKRKAVSKKRIKTVDKKTLERLQGIEGEDNLVFGLLAITVGLGLLVYINYTGFVLDIPSALSLILIGVGFIFVMKSVKD